MSKMLFRTPEHTTLFTVRPIVSIVTDIMQAISFIRMPPLCCSIVGQRQSERLAPTEWIK